MANQTAVINVVVKNRASNPLVRIANAIRKLGTETKKAGVNFTQFNRTLFSATALIGTFTRALDGFNRSLTEGADYDRVVTRFESAFGPKGAFIEALAKTTDRTVDSMQAMRSGIRLNTLGIIKDQNQLINIMSKASVMAAEVGISSGEGIKAISDILETGNITQAKNLGLVSATNQEYMIQQGILKSVGKGLGGYVKMQHRLNLVMSLLDSKTKGLMKGFADQRDTLQGVQDALGHLKGEVGRFLGVALQPFLKGLSTVIMKLTSWLEAIQKNHKDFAKFIGNIIHVSGAILGFITLVGALTLALKMLSFVGLGPLGAFTMLAMGVAILQDMDTSTEDLLESLHTFGQVLKGIWQLTSSFISGDRRMAFIDEDTKEFLEGKGLLGLVITLSKVFGIIGSFIVDVGKDFVAIWKFAAENIGELIKKFGDLVGIDTGAWWSGLVDNSNLLRRGVVALTAGVLSLIVALKALAAIKGLGVLLGLSGGKAAGTATTVATTAAGTGILAKIKNAVSGFFKKGPVDPFTGGRKDPLGRRIITKLGTFFRKLPGTLLRIIPKIATGIITALKSAALWTVAAKLFAVTVGIILGNWLGDWAAKNIPGWTKLGEWAAGDDKPEIIDPTEMAGGTMFTKLQRESGRGILQSNALTAEETIAGLESKFGELEDVEKAKIRRMAAPDQQMVPGSGAGIDIKEWERLFESLGNRLGKPLDETAENTKKSGDILKPRKDREAMSG